MLIAQTLKDFLGMLSMTCYPLTSWLCVKNPTGKFKTTQSTQPSNSMINWTSESTSGTIRLDEKNSTEFTIDVDHRVKVQMLAYIALILVDFLDDYDDLISLQKFIPY